MDMVQTTLLKPATIRKRQAKLREYIAALERQLTHARQELSEGFQDRCPHPIECVHTHYGQYQPCEDICSLCGAIVN